MQPYLLSSTIICACIHCTLTEACSGVVSSHCRTYLKKCKQHVFLELVAVPESMWMAIAFVIMYAATQIHTHAYPDIRDPCRAAEHCLCCHRLRFIIHSVDLYIRSVVPNYLDFGNNLAGYVRVVLCTPYTRTHTPHIARTHSHTHTHTPHQWQWQRQWQ